MKPHIEHYVRQPDNRWLLAEADSLPDTVHLASMVNEVSALRFL